MNLSRKQIKELSEHHAGKRLLEVVVTMNLQLEKSMGDAETMGLLEKMVVINTKILRVIEILNKKKKK